MNPSPDENSRPDPLTPSQTDKRLQQVPPTKLHNWHSFPSFNYELSYVTTSITKYLQHTRTGKRQRCCYIKAGSEKEGKNGKGDEIKR